MTGLVVKAVFDDPILDHFIDGILQPPVELPYRDGIEMRGDVRGFDQSAQWEVASSLAPT